MSKQYICYSGFVKSNSDGDVHYISASRVAQLYRLNPNDCIFIDSPSDLEHKTRGYTATTLAKMTRLWPQGSGDYEL